MRCVHCSSLVERKDWFCPNCRRSPRAAVDLRPPDRPGWRVYCACVAIAAALTAAGVVVGMRLAARPAPLADDEAVISVRELPPPPVTGRIEVEAAAGPAAAIERNEAPRVHSRDERALEHVAERPARRRALAAERKAEGAVTVVTVPAVPTFVYLNGGSLLGEAPLQDAVLPAGRHKLIFWTPSLGGRSTRVVDVQAGEKVLVVQEVRQQTRFADAGG